MLQDVQLGAYFARIGYAGARSASLQTLNDLHALHPAVIAFENLDVLLRRPIALAPESIAAKLVRGGRGGNCFEQNTLFLTVLRSLGFSASAIGARPGPMRGANGRKLGGVRFGRKLKLTPHQRAEAIARREAGEPQTEIGRSYNVSHATISRL